MSLYPGVKCSLLFALPQRVAFSSRLSLDDPFFPGCRLHGMLPPGSDPDDPEDPDDDDGVDGDDDDEEEEEDEEGHALNPLALEGGGAMLSGSPVPPLSSSQLPPYDHSSCSLQLHKSCACVNFIAEHTKAKEEATKVRCEMIQVWKVNMLRLRDLKQQFRAMPVPV